MSARSFVGDSIRKVIGNDRYARLRHGYKAEHSYLRKIDGLIHIGANEGQERDFYAAFDLDVVWIEPIPHVFASLKRNISGFSKQRAYNYLVTDEDGKEYQLNIADNGGASSSILDLGKHTTMYPHIAYEGAITLRSVTLGTILEAERIDVRQYTALLLDTQGSELKILQGATDLLSNFKFIKVEVPDFESYSGCCQIGELGSFMSSSGFREVSRHPIVQTPGVGTYFDILYERTRR